jgi:hypothetical protein
MTLSGYAVVGMVGLMLVGRTLLGIACYNLPLVSPLNASRGCCF